MSYGLFMPHYEQNAGGSGRASLLKKGLIQSNRDFSSYLQVPAPYMENERTKLKKNNKKNDTLGNVNKPPCDFTADLNILSHQTAFMKAAQKRMNFKESLSLEHMRMKDKVMNEGTKLLTRDDLQDDMQNQSLMTHQAMQKEMLEN